MGRLSEFSAEEADYFRGTSALEATLVQQALDRQREELAAEVEELGCINYGCSFAEPGEIDHGRRCPVGIAAMIREGGDQ